MIKNWVTVSESLRTTELMTDPLFGTSAYAPLCPMATIDSYEQEEGGCENVMNLNPPFGITDTKLGQTFTYVV
ncbi:hypothetical protein TNCV_784561 [Trichonephila clavipes]|nr:hypothetical protein TNCV_784561 [Trichonephila clavipes]